MAVTVLEVRKLLKDNSTVTISGEDENLFFLVRVQEQSATPYDIRNLAGNYGGVVIPAMRAVHGSNANMSVVKKSAKRFKDGTAHVWLLEVNYDYNLTGNSTNGESREVRIRVSGAEQAIVTQLTAGDSPQPIRNALGDLYPGGVEASIFDEVIEVDFYTQTLDMDGISATRGKMNESIVTMNLPQGALTFTRSFDTRTLRVLAIDYDISISQAFTNPYAWHVTLVLGWREDGWDKRLPEKGYRWRDPTTEQITDWKDTEEYLDENGYKLPEGAELVIKEGVQVYEEADLATLLEGITT